MRSFGNHIPLESTTSFALVANQQQRLTIKQTPSSVMGHAPIA